MIPVRISGMPIARIAAVQPFAYSLLYLRHMLPEESRWQAPLPFLSIHVTLLRATAKWAGSERRAVPGCRLRAGCDAIRLS